MGYDVFISYSTSDLNLVTEITNQLKQFGANCYVADNIIEAGELLSDKIENAINRADCVLVILTEEGFRSQWVNQEIGLAKAKGKTIIPIIESGVTVAGVLQGIEYIPLDKSNPQNFLNKLTERITDLKKSKDSTNLLVYGALGALALLWLTTREEN